MTFLEAVNKVLVKLRENTVTSVNETPYSQLIGEFINDTKKEIEAVWNWEALRTTIPITTSNGVFNYTITGSNTRTKLFDIWDDTNKKFLATKPRSWFVEQLGSSNPESHEPMYYGFNGITANGELKLDIYPIPNGAYTLEVNCVLPQDDLVNNADTISVPGYLVVEGALAKAISERGEDGGFTEQELRYTLKLSDAIAIEAARHSDETEWVST